MIGRGGTANGCQVKGEGQFEPGLARSESWHAPISVVDDSDYASSGAFPIRGVGPDELCLIHAAAGLALWQADRGQILLDGNSFLITTCGRWSRFRSAPGEQPTVVLLSNLRPSLRSLAASKCVPDFVGETSSVLRGLLHDCRLRGGATDVQEAKSSELGRAIIAAVEQTALRPLRRQSPMIRRAKEIVHRDLTRRRSLESVAELLAVSPSYLTQAFKKAEGISFYKYQLCLSIGAAMNQLPDCDDITALAYKLGFSSHSHFSTTFKALMGISPSRFRQNHATAG